MESKSIVKPPESRRIKAGMVKLLPGEEVGAHVTEGREEIIVVTKGVGRLEIAGSGEKIEEGKAYFVGEGKLHNVRNDSSKRLEYFYITAGLD